MTGVWIGQTVNSTSALHLWVFVQSGKTLTIYTSWMGFDKDQGVYQGLVAPESPHFTLLAEQALTIGVSNGNVFTVPEWVLAAKGEDLVPRYDVLFQKCDRGITALFYSLYIALFSWSPDMLRQLI